MKASGTGVSILLWDMKASGTGVSILLWDMKASGTGVSILLWDVNASATGVRDSWRDIYDYKIFCTKIINYILESKKVKRKDSMLQENHEIHAESGGGEGDFKSSCKQDAL